MYERLIKSVKKTLYKTLGNPKFRAVRVSDSRYREAFDQPPFDIPRKRRRGGTGSNPECVDVGTERLRGRGTRRGGRRSNQTVQASEGSQTTRVE